NFQFTLHLANCDDVVFSSIPSRLTKLVHPGFIVHDVHIGIGFLADYSQNPSERPPCKSPWVYPPPASPTPVWLSCTGFFTSHRYWSAQLANRHCYGLI